MIKLTILIKRHKDMTQEQFIDYHKNKHAPLFKSLPETQQYVRKYIQSHSNGVNLPGMPQPIYDGMTELWFDDMESIGKLFTAERYMQTIRPDEEKFIDLHGCSFIISTEYHVI